MSEFYGAFYPRGCFKGRGRGDPMEERRAAYSETSCPVSASPPSLELFLDEAANVSSNVQ